MNMQLAKELKYAAAETIFRHSREFGYSPGNIRKVTKKDGARVLVWDTLDDRMQIEIPDDMTDEMIEAVGLPEVTQTEDAIAAWKELQNPPLLGTEESLVAWSALRDRANVGRPTPP